MELYKDMEERWYSFLSYWAVLTGLVFVTMMGVFMAALPSDNSLSMEQGMLQAALHKALAFRVLWTLDSLIWMGIGGVLLSFAAIYLRRAPVRAALLGAAAVGQVVGATGGFVWTNSVSQYAHDYATATTSQQATMLKVLPALTALTSAQYGVGELLYGAGFILIAWLALSYGGLPRWLALFIGIIGAYDVLNQAHFVTTGSFFPGTLFMITQLLEAVLYFTIGIAAWRRTRRTAVVAQTSPVV